MGREAACRRSTRPRLILLAAILSLGSAKTAEALSSSGGGRSSLRLAEKRCDCQDVGKGQSLRALVLDRGDASVLVHRLRGGHRMRWDLFKHLLSRYDTDKDSFLSRDEVGQIFLDPQTHAGMQEMAGRDPHLPGVPALSLAHCEHRLAPHSLICSRRAV